MWVPLAVLAFAAVVALALALPGSMLFEHYLAPVFEPGTQRLLATGHFHAGAHPSWPYFVAWGIAAAGTAVAWVMYVGPAIRAPANLAASFPRVYQFAVDKFRVDELYAAVILEPLKTLAYLLWRIVDVFAIDGFIVTVLARGTAWISSVVRLAQNGDVQRYAALMAVAAAAILWTVVGAGGR
jgi:NADH-quinone oxidoreductase subunit L